MDVIELNGKQYNRPTCYEDITTRQYERIVSEWDMTKHPADRNYFQLFCILVNADFKMFHETSENEVTLMNSIKWYWNSEFKFDETLPKALKIGDKIVMLPTDVGDLSPGQNIHLRQYLDTKSILQDADGNVLDYTSYAMAVAVYLQPILDESKFDFKRALELEKQIAEMPIYLIRPIGFFIIANVLNYGRKPERSWLKTLTNHTRTAKRTLQTWLSGNGLYLMRTLVW